MTECSEVILKLLKKCMKKKKHQILMYEDLIAGFFVRVHFCKKAVRRVVH